MFVGKISKVPVTRKRPKLMSKLNEIIEEQNRGRALPGHGTRLIETPLGVIHQAAPAEEQEAEGGSTWLP
jgi:hypothetical protein